MKRTNQPAVRLTVIAVVALCALSAAAPLAAGCLEDGQASYQNCIELMATFNGGEVSASAEATCSELAGELVDSCFGEQKSYVACSQPYSIWFTTDASGETQLVVAFFGEFTCE